MKTKKDLRKLAAEKFKDIKLLVVSHREPYIHSYSKETITCEQPVSGLTSAINPILKALGGTWLAYGSGKADKKVVDNEDIINVPPNEESYLLRRIWLTREELEGYYDGFSNNMMWPLCHNTEIKPVFDIHDWETYKSVNRKFAECVLEEIKNDKTLIFIQDYHFAMLPKYLRELGVKDTIIHFWHIPWPTKEIFHTCPFRREILESLLANDMLGFQIKEFCNNFFESVENELPVSSDRDNHTIMYNKSSTLIRPFNISVDIANINKVSSSKNSIKLRKALARGHRLRNKRIILGVDRLDYSKGILERLKAYDIFLERYNDTHGKVVLVQIGVKSRIFIQSYMELNEKIEDTIKELNWKYEKDNWTPVIYLSTGLSPDKLFALYGMADIMLVSSLHDGMNLVCKEYISARNDLKGVLILSKFTGAAEELSDALIIDPYITSEFADTIKQGLEMPLGEQERKMRAMRQVIQNHNIYDWACDIISAIHTHGKT